MNETEQNKMGLMKQNTKGIDTTQFYTTILSYSSSKNSTSGKGYEKYLVI